MITCPDCGQTTADETRFCERCGRGLLDVPAKTALAPLTAGEELDGRFKIVELLSQSSEENRYRATALDDPSARFVLRERSAPQQPVGQTLSELQDEAPAQAPASEAIDPRAPTRDLSQSAAVQAASEPASAVAETPVILDEQQAAPTGDGSDDHQGSTADHAGGTDEVTVDGVPAPEPQSQPDAAPEPAPVDEAESEEEEPVPRADLGDVFERVLALSHTLTHPAFYCPTDGFVARERAYLVYRDQALEPFARGQRVAKLAEADAVAIGVQLCQALAFLHKRGLRLNDLCPSSIAYGSDGRIKLTGLDYISNDDELQAVPILNDGYTAPEIYRGKNVDKRADIFSIGAMLYSCLTGERIDSETWREEAGPIRFYPPYALSPALEPISKSARAR
jgi:hypothetical protein